MACHLTPIAGQANRIWRVSADKDSTTKTTKNAKVDPHTRKYATLALERMLSIKGTGNPIAPDNASRPVPTPIVSQEAANRIGVID